MIPQAHITAWRSNAPWADDAQVEQDLVLTRAMTEIFADPTLASLFAMRGGTALNKLILDQPSRYSEDIDLVQSKPAPIGPALDQLRAILDPWLGKPRRAIGEGLVTLTYRFESEIAPVRPLRLKIEINTREHFSVLGLTTAKFSCKNPWFAGSAEISTYQLDELMGTKMRALYQRKKGRDLFDLWLAVGRNHADPETIVRCFLEYMEHGGLHVSRAEYEQNIRRKLDDPAFLRDITPLLANNITFDSAAATTIVLNDLAARLPGEPWNGKI